MRTAKAGTATNQPRPATEIVQAAQNADRLIAALQIELSTIRRLASTQHGSTGKTDRSQAAENKRSAR